MRYVSSTDPVSCFKIEQRCDTIRYDTIRYTTFARAQQLTNNQLNLPHGTKQKKSNEETKDEKSDAQKKRSSHKVRVVSSEAGREPTVGKIL